MARKAREKSSTGIYHILLRANNKLFLNDGDKEYFMSLMKQHFADGVSVFGYRTDMERVHIVLKEHTKTISEAMKAFCTSYARYFNRVHGIDGKLFDGRFKSEPVESDETLADVLGYLYRDNASAFKKDEIISHDELGGVKPSKASLAMDDYTSMSDSELAEVINFLCKNKLDTMTDDEKLAEVAKADKASRLKSTMVKRALGIKSAETKKATPKKTTNKKAVSAKKTPTKKVTEKTKKVTEKQPKEVKVTEKTVAVSEEKETIAPKPKKKELPVWLL